MTIRWESSLDARKEAARFLAAHIRSDDAYISHGEVQEGLSLDAKTWARDLEKRFVEDLLDLGADQMLAVKRDGSGAMVAAGIVQWVKTPRVIFGVIEDLVVPAAMRSSGIGAEMMAWIEAEAVKRKCRWLFLESGKNNLRAHAFFERHGFEELSHVFIKPVRSPAKRAAAGKKRR